MLAGCGGSTIETGRLIKSPRETPLCNLYLSMLEKAGCPRDHFADSAAPIEL